ncbi:NAD(+) synthase [Floccifex sp.]|uniref:NAD(+) synthase n=1 Tax=Floccifex sp. TaxID=2815810 RepID=UPI002A75C43D|nr:NAD(+) synthase [Floccifex sp.]MDD7280734.1 NAD(+) synthase [Erysipelotrichaceae bacterium]MDY2957565.1 NAD(+) synthase [Floccifex sp.]
MNRFQFYKVASCTPSVSIGNPSENKKEILNILNSLDSDTQLAVFPELCISGYTCQDLFYEELLLNKSKEAVIELAHEIPKNMAVVVGLPLVVKNKLYNCAAFLFNGQILGIYAKTYIPMYNEFYEKRWFSSGKELDTHSIQLGNQIVPISNKIIFKDKTCNAVIGIEICEDLWVTIPMSSSHALAGANILVNPSASNEVIAKTQYRTDLVKNQSARTYSAYVYASAGCDESTSDLVFSGHNLICENGSLLKQGFNEKYIISEIDLQHLQHDRIHYKTSMEDNVTDYIEIEYESKAYDTIQCTRTFDAYPFVPHTSQQRIERCQEILSIQAQGLATRLKKIHCNQVVIGISGGLDSTLALLVCNEAFKMNGYNNAGIHAITMPGFGTTKRTKNNAQLLMDLLHVSSEEISIVPGVQQHFKDIHHDENVHDITYENSQARQRTYLLMDLANKYNGIVVGTGDLSELALGWCTYNGDHMSMYAVNASVPKTLVRYIVESYALKEESLRDVLLDICDTPVSPELLPPDQNGKIQQKTEEVLGSYDLHDFFLYHMLRFHESPLKIYECCKEAFKDIDEETVKKAIHTFYHRFFTQQFKRNCMPDGVKVGSICFSPRGDWRMPSDASSQMWKDELEKIA